LKKIIFEIMLAILVTSALVLAVKIETVKADGTIYINADGSVTPSTAPIATSDNVTYSFTADINGSIQVNRTNTIIDGVGHTLADGVLTLQADNITVCDMNIVGWDEAIAVDSSFNVIRNNTITATNTSQYTFPLGIFLAGDIPSPSGTIGLSQITQNIIENCAAYGGGIGIEVYSGQNEIFGNELFNDGTGLMLPVDLANGNRIFENNITGNDYGVQLTGDPEIAGWPYNNTFYHNNFINNTFQASVGSASVANAWDNGYPSGGNYWSDYSGTDIYCGAYQNQTGSDGIGDTPHTIDANNIDHYPLMKPYPWDPHDVGITYIGRVYKLEEPVHICVFPPKTIGFISISLHLDVFVMNYGDYPEALNLTVYANDSIVGQVSNVTLTAKNSTIIDFLWNTSAVAKGNYIISAYLEPVPGETDVKDNTYIDGTIKITIPGDVNGDGIVDIRDIHSIAQQYGTTPLSPNWIPNADINDDGKVDIRDIHIAAANYGQHYP